MNSYLSFLQIILSLLIIGLVLLQPRGGGLGSAFGESGAFFATRRGIQKKLFFLTLFAGLGFIVLGIFNLLQ